MERKSRTELIPFYNLTPIRESMHMLVLQPLRRCRKTKKIIHATQAAAWSQALWLAQKARRHGGDLRHSRPLRAFYCKYCQGFHVGHSCKAGVRGQGTGVRS